MTDAERIEALEELKGHAGWSLIEQVMRDELAEAMYKLSARPNVDQQLLDYSRGAIAAGHRLLSLPDRMIQALQNDAVYEQTRNQEPTP